MFGLVGTVGMAVPGKCGWKKAVSEMDIPDDKSFLGTLCEAQMST